MKKILCVFMFSFLLVNNVLAAECTNSDKVKLNDLAKNVKINYDITTKKVEYADMTADVDQFKISILNITEDIYITVQNDQGMGLKTYTSKDAEDGVVSFTWDKINEITNFTVIVYASNNTNCGSTKLTTLYKQTPRYNSFSERDICADEEMKDFYLCQRYVTFDEVNTEGFVNKVEDFIEGKIDPSGQVIEDNPTFMDKVFEFLDHYKWFIIGGVVIGASAGGYIYYRKTRKQRELGL